eukprot:TRINITY_DN31926_c0_g1_i1.p1 TRINITY_DN31926_c0_g1~~TRINITY_DN31926_c0_g1_i1.p1  ORF type:complete len:542 (-),score=122.27 TRINITY_DN31926_c0_g1_i1:76-1701(-)
MFPPLLSSVAGLVYFISSVDALGLQRQRPASIDNHLVVNDEVRAARLVDLDLTNLVGAQSGHAAQFGASKGSAAHTQGPGGVHVQNASIDGMEILCLNCQQQLFAAWLNQLSGGAFNDAAHVDAVGGGVGGKHPNAPGYDKWNNGKDADKDEKEGKSFLATSNRTLANGSRTLEISSYSLVDIEPNLKLHLKYLWEQRRLVIGAGINPLQKPMNFVQALVSLSRKSPQLMPPNCTGREEEAARLGNHTCDTFLSGLEPVATRPQLLQSLQWTFGAEFLRRNSYEADLSADEQRQRVKSLLLALKHSYRFYHQFCLTHDVGAETCDGAAASQIMGTIACQPQDDQPSDDCMYAEVRYCPKCEKQGRLFEYSRLHGPLALFGTGLNRNWVMGQCEEFSRAGYTLLATLGWTARYVLDFTDHVWIEVWLADGKNGGHKWVHADPSEGVLDSPLMYETGWGKQLTMIFAFTPWSVTHVTATYTKDYNATVARRQIPESLLDKIVGQANEELNAALPLATWGYRASATSKDRALEEVMLWQHFEAH